MQGLRIRVNTDDHARIMFGLLWIGIGRGYFEQAGVEAIPVLGDAQVGAGADAVDVRCSSPADLARWAIEDAPVVAIVSQEQWRDGRGLTPIGTRKVLLERGELTQDPASLRGKRIGIEHSGSGQMRAEPDWILFHHALGRAGLTFDDVTVVDTSHGSGESKLKAGEIDLVTMGRPRAVVVGEEAGWLQRWAECWELAPRQGRCVVANRSLLDARPDEVQAFVTGWVRASRDYVDAVSEGKGREEIIELLHEYTGERREVLERMSPLGANPNGAMDPESMQRDAETWAEHGLLPRSPTMSRMVESGFVEAALEQLGPYE